MEFLGTSDVPWRHQSVQNKTSSLLITIVTYLANGRQLYFSHFRFLSNWHKYFFVTETKVTSISRLHEAAHTILCYQRFLKMLTLSKRTQFSLSARSIKIYRQKNIKDIRTHSIAPPVRQRHVTEQACWTSKQEQKEHVYGNTALSVVYTSTKWQMSPASPDSILR